MRGAGPGLSQVELYLEGVHCAACVWLIERLPTILEGVVEVRLGYAPNGRIGSFDLAPVTAWDAPLEP